MLKASSKEVSKDYVPVFDQISGKSPEQTVITGRRTMAM